MIAHPALPPLCRAGHTAGRSRVCASGRAYCLAGWCCTPLCCGWGGVVGPASRQAGAGRQAEGFAFAARLPHMALVHPPTPPATHPHRLSPMHLHTSCPPRLASPLFFTSGPHRPAAAPRLPHPGARRQRRRRLHGCPGARRRDKGGGGGGVHGRVGWAARAAEVYERAAWAAPPEPALPACLPARWPKPSRGGTSPPPAAPRTRPTASGCHGRSGRRWSGSSRNCRPGRAHQPGRGMPGAACQNRLNQTGLLPSAVASPLACPPCRRLGGGVDMMEAAPTPQAAGCSVTKLSRLPLQGAGR